MRQEQSGEAVIQPCGAVVLHGAADDQPFDAPDGTARVAWDLSLVSDIDARGLGALADAARRARARGVQVSIRAASIVVHRLAALARLDTVIPGAWHARVETASPCDAPCPDAPT